MSAAPAVSPTVPLAQATEATSRAAASHPGRRTSPPAEADSLLAVEAERGRIARELHDSVGQTLAGILLNLELLERHLGSGNGEASIRLARSRELAVLALDQIRRISHELHPPEWSELDFPAALECMIENMALRAKLAVEVGEVHVPDGSPAAVKTMLYRIAQEALSNVLRHSGAGRVMISVPASAGDLKLIIEDDGCGFDPAAAHPGIGLANMQHRAAALGGTLQIQSAPGRGVRLQVFVPLHQTP